MDPINSQGGMGPQMYALKKAIDSQEQGILNPFFNSNTSNYKHQLKALFYGVLLMFC